MNICGYCNNESTIKYSHVVPSFMGQHIKKNSPFGWILNTWNSKVKYDIYKGPYLCRKCDNEIFSSWEDGFSRDVWKNPTDSLFWNTENTIRFCLSIPFRFALHFLDTSPIQYNRSYTEYVRDISLDGLNNVSIVSKNIYILMYINQLKTRVICFLA